MMMKRLLSTSITSTKKHHIELDIKYIKSKIKKWSLQSLASMNEPPSSMYPSNAPTVTPTKNNIKYHNNNNNNNNNKKKKNAQVLLQDINYRLCNQYHKCIQMINQVKNTIHEEQSLLVVKNNNDKKHQDDTKPKVIKAINQRVDKYDNSNNYYNKIKKDYTYSKQNMDQIKKIIQEEKEKVLKILHNLQLLHFDTFHLTKELLDTQENSNNDSSDKNINIIFKRFSNVDQYILHSTFEQIRSRHATTVENLADVVIGLKYIDKLLMKCNDHFDRDDYCYKPSVDSKIIDSFLKERLSIQLLCDHYVALSKQHKLNKQQRKEGEVIKVNDCSSGTNRSKIDYGGGVSVGCNFIHVLSDAIFEAKHICDANLGTVPEVYLVLPKGNTDDNDDNDNHFNQGIEQTSTKNTKISLHSGIMDDVKDIPITLVRPWVHHVLVEILKNAMSSNVEKFLQDQRGNDLSSTIIPSSSDGDDIRTTQLPTSIYIKIHDSKENLICEIMDQGIGLLNDYENIEQTKNKDGCNIAEKSFEFAFSTSSQRWDRLDEQQSYAMVRSPIGSLGVGLTLSRMMMEMFGGRVRLDNRRSGLILGFQDTKQSGELVLDSGCTATVVINRDPRILEWDCQGV